MGMVSEEQLLLTSPSMLDRFHRHVCVRSWFLGTTSPMGSMRASLSDGLLSPCTETRKEVQLVRKDSYLTVCGILWNKASKQQAFVRCLSCIRGEDIAVIKVIEEDFTRKSRVASLKCTLIFCT